MKRALIASALSLVTSVSALASPSVLSLDAASAISCTYSGTATWKTSNGTTGTCDMTTTIDHRANGEIAVATVGQCSDGSSRNCHFVIVPGQNDFFDVRDGSANGNVVGHGYCFGNECHYSAWGHSQEEVLTFNQNDSTLHRVGSSWGHNGTTTAWTMDLTRTIQAE